MSEPPLGPGVLEAAREFKDAVAGMEGVTSVTISSPGHDPVTLPGAAAKRDRVDTTTGEVVDRYPIPEDRQFEMEGDAEFLPAPDLEMLWAKVLMWPEMKWLQKYTVRLLWKRDGGKSGGNVTLGKCVRPSGLTAYFAETDWVIWVAADHLRFSGFTKSQVEALLFHEACHCELKGEDEVPGTKGHDLEMFRAEVTRYGLWRDGLRTTAEVMQQALPGFKKGGRRE
jgi:hypothetical protein